ncbi:MAG: peptidoglycan-binding protein [Ferrovibrio sp.]|uniref:peptidoglycan-binding domain-containing protein n=1 Tax=Ferrovibrio sp. TaxID=1917215 RepID=UPI00262D4F3F|nr:peptidoglycan-binding domain-containing protein [Ferrovibrio sp.]MCW0236138.1 peptidoglycan-binding protein [Ferrovibrio sp.]
MPDLLTVPGLDERLFELSGSVGIGRINRRADVFKLQTLLHREGYLDAAGPEGGWGGDWGNRDDYALRRFQRDNGLVIDGIAEPEGETMGTLRGFHLPPVTALPLRGSRHAA